MTNQQNLLHSQWPCILPWCNLSAAAEQWEIRFMGRVYYNKWIILGFLSALSLPNHSASQRKTFKYLHSLRAKENGNSISGIVVVPPSHNFATKRNRCRFKSSSRQNFLSSNACSHYKYWSAFHGIWFISSLQCIAWSCVLCTSCRGIYSAFQRNMPPWSAQMGSKHGMDSSGRPID